MKKLNKQEIDFLIETLEKGEELPHDYKYRLFPTKQKEYELAYAGKMRKEDLLANEDGVFPVPLQMEKIFNGDEYELFNDGWENMIIFGDNLQFLKTIYENKDPLIKDKVKGKVKLIYIDPPFASADEFQNKEGAKAYTDKKKGAEFVEFLRKRLILAKEILADDGIICLHLDQKMSHYIKILMDEIFLKNRFQNEIIWYYSTLGRPKDRFAKKHDSILVYAKTDSSFFNENEVRVPYSKEYIKSHFNDTDDKGRQCRKRYDAGKWRTYYPDEGMIPNDVWEIPYENSMSTDRTDYPTQKPEPLIEKFIKAYTKKNDVVLDFFGGSGTTMAVAEKLGRKWLICDLGKLAYFTMQKRILKIQDSKDLENPKKKYGKKAKSFVTAQLGIYDYAKVKDLEWQEYQKFVSSLFEVEIKENKIAGLEFDGKKGNYPVKIFNYRQFGDSLINKSYVEEMHNIIGKRASRVYIIAPINCFDFLKDYHEIDAVRYYFLKIPYRVINELHKTPFYKLRQPQSKKNVNELDEAVGFHFIWQPEVKSKIKKDKDKVSILIQKFESKEPDSGKSQSEKKMKGFNALSAVFVDKNYNGKAFEMDECFFADELLKEKEGWKIPFNKSELGKQIMVIYTDIYGNDFTETLSI